MKKRGKGKFKENLTTVSVRYTDEEMYILESLCNELNLSKSDVLRLLLADEYKHRERYKATEDFKEVNKRFAEYTEVMNQYLFEVSKASVNINQIAKKLNTQKEVDNKLRNDVVKAFNMLKASVDSFAKKHNSEVQKIWQSLK